MKYRNYVGLLSVAVLSLALCACDSQPKQPLPAIPKKSVPVEDEYSPINRDEVEANNRGQKPAASAAPADDPVAARSESRDAKPIEPVPDLAGSIPWLDADGSQLPMEYWEVQYFNAQRIGMTHYRIEAEKNGLKIRMETNMDIRSGQRSLRQAIVIETHETMDGRMDRFSEMLTSGPMTTQTRGFVMSKEIRLETASDQQNTKKQMEWQPGSWGPLGIHQMLHRKPMMPKEARQAKVFLPQMHQLADVTLVAGELESTTSPDGLLADVLPIDVVMQLAKDGIRVRMWTDAAGHVQKTIWPEGLNLSSFRISKAMADQLQAEDEIKALLDARLACEPTDVQLGEISQASQVQFTIVSEQADPHKLFSVESNQTVKAEPVYGAVVTVFQPDWNTVPTAVKQSPPSLKELNSTALVPTEHPAIQRLAQSWAGPASEPTEVAKALLAAANANFRRHDFGPSIHAVPAVAQSLEGNCVEQSLLLVALLRNRQIPARLASGVHLVEQNGQLAFGYHMWTEAWLNEHWVPMDPSRGQLTGCAYVKFIDTSLADGNLYQPIIAVLKVLKTLKVSHVARP